MKKKYNLLALGVVFFSLNIFTACNNAEYSVLTNQVYIAQTNTNGNTSQKITIGDSPISASVNLRCSDVVTQNTEFELVSDPAALETFNKRNETAYLPFPSELFSLSSSTVGIKANTTTSDAVTLTINPFTQALKESGQKYAIALRARSKNGESNMLESGSTIVYILDQVVRQDVPTFTSSNTATFRMRQTYALSEWTVEFNVNMSKLGTGIGQMNNQALFSASGNDASEIYTRFGDAPIEGNRLQIKTQGTQMNSTQLFDANKWYHIAFVCTGSQLYLYVNGVLDNSMPLPGKVLNLDRPFGFSGSMVRDKMQVSEVRFWTKARTQAQIANNMYACDPKSEGLEAYWKLNEGTGATFNDATGNGNTGTCTSVPTWTQNVRIDGK